MPVSCVAQTGRYSIVHISGRGFEHTVIVCAATAISIGCCSSEQAQMIDVMHINRKILSKSLMLDYSQEISLNDATFYEIFLLTYPI
jgi:hypothetical protein